MTPPNGPCAAFDSAAALELESGACELDWGSHIGCLIGQPNADAFREQAARHADGSVSGSGFLSRKRIWLKTGTNIDTLDSRLSRLQTLGP